jgi:ABC-type multidrug transport system fused ATPase/permease subunit
MFFKTLAKLWPFARPYRVAIAGVFLSGIFVAILTNCIQFFVLVMMEALERKNIFAEHPEFVEKLSRYIDVEKLRPFTEDYPHVVKVIALTLPIYYLFLGACRYYNGFHSRYIAERIVNEMRYSIMSRMLSLSPSYYSNTHMATGSLISRTLSDATLVQWGMTQYMDLMREPFIALIALGTMLWYSWKLTFFTLIFAPIVGIIVSRIAKRLKSLSARSQESLDVVSKNLKEAIDGIRIIQSYNDEENMRARFRQSIHDYNGTRKKVI